MYAIYLLGAFICGILLITVLVMRGDLSWGAESYVRDALWDYEMSDVGYTPKQLKMVERRARKEYRKDVRNYKITCLMLALMGVGLLANSVVAYDSEVQDILDGEPTYKGRVTGVYVLDDRDMHITLSSGHGFVINKYNNDILIGHTYEFWLHGERLLDMKEV